MLESHFWHGVSEADLHNLRRPLIQVYCRCPIELAIERYTRRIDDADRHPGHVPEHQTAELIARWSAVEPTPLALEAPLIEVDTTGPVDVQALAHQVVAVLQPGK